MSLSFSELSSESSLEFGYDRKRHLKRSNSIDSYFTIPRVWESPRFDHRPPHHEVGQINYRTMVALKWGHDGNYNISYLAPTKDSYHRYDNHFRRRYIQADGYSSDESKNSDRTDSSDESITLDKTNSSDEWTTLEVSDPEIAQIPEPECPLEEALCGRCQGINVERLAEENGYTHSFFNVLERSITSCPLCRTFFDAVNDRDVKWTLNRYKITLSLESPQYLILSDHHLAPIRYRKCVWISVIDTRPWESREVVKRLFEKKEVSQKLPLEDHSIMDLRILCYTEEGDPAVRAGVPWLRKPDGHTGSPVALGVAKSWLEQCIAAENQTESFRDVDSDHQSPQTSPTDTVPNMRNISSGTQNLQIRKSKRPNDEIMHINSETQPSTSSFSAERPSRLIEIVKYCDTQSSDRIVRLVETNGQDYEYAALSYCWGSPTGSWLTTKGTLDESFHRIDIQNLPATLKDAIYVTFSLGLKYLWVDALCIIQDSTHDWETESAMMGGIYRGAQLTIAASKSSSSSEGCFNQDQYPQHNPFADYTCVESRLKNNRVSRLYFEKVVDTWGRLPRSGSFHAEVYESPLASRAWTYQEQILSRRTLFFAQSQLYWECDHCRLSLDRSQQAQHRRAYPVLTFSEPMSANELIERWYKDAAEVYSRRKLTNPTDRLVAISAIAKATFLNRRINYIAGLWEDCIFAGLCWYRRGPGSKSRSFSCPSWSWASQESGICYGAIKHDFEEPGDSATSPNILSIQLEMSDKNPFGDVTVGRITLLTRVTRGVVMRDKFGRYNISYALGYTSLSDKKALLIPEANGWKIWHGIAIMDDDDAYQRQTVAVALVSDWNPESQGWLMILLEPAGECEQEYKRVGIAVLDHTDGQSNGKRVTPNIERDWDERIITIV